MLVPTLTDDWYGDTLPTYQERRGWNAQPKSISRCFLASLSFSDPMSRIGIVFVIVRAMANARGDCVRREYRQTDRQ